MRLRALPTEIDDGAGPPLLFPWVCPGCCRCYWRERGDETRDPVPSCLEAACCRTAWQADESLGREENPGDAFTRALSRVAFERGRAVGRQEALVETRGRKQ